MRSISRFLLSGALTVALAAPAAAQSTSFESGLGGYAAGGWSDVGVSSNWNGITPQNGSWLAYVTGPFSTLTSNAFTAAAGSTLSFYVNAVFTDYLPYNDFVFAKLLVGGIDYTTLYYRDLQSVCGSACSGFGASGWESVNYTFTSAGTYQLQFGANDLHDTVGNPTLLVDNIASGTSVTPEPVSMALLGTGLAGLGAVRRRRRRDAEI